MNNFLSSSLFFGVALSLLTYWIGMLLKKKFRSPLFNPLLISVILTIVFLLLTGVDYSTYNEGARSLSYFLTPSTVCLAIPLYQQLEILKKNWKAVIFGVAAGTLASLVSILLLSIAFGLTHEQYVTLLPKSITTAIALGVSTELGGMAAVTSACVVITGILGNAIAETVLKLARIEDPIAKGLACGTSAHAIGTAKAMELGELEGAMSSLSICVAGLMTVLAATFFANLY
jgi:predicted murein hydrolase (TIGR00659 family)